MNAILNPLKLYKSSAGSGKTYTLVREYLNLVLKNPDLYKNILAITFTNKAANEMKERILSKLKELQIKKNDLYYDLLKSTNLKSESILKKNCNRVLKNILHNYSEFAIMTIDSFIFKIVKSFSLELELPLNFEVDLNITLLVQKITDNLIDSAGKDEYVTDILKRFVLEKMDTSSTWDFTKDIVESGKEIFKEQSQSDIRKLRNMNFNKVIKQLFNEQRKVKLSLKEIGKKISAIYYKVEEKDLPKRSPKSALLYMIKINEDDIFSDLEKKVYEKIIDNDTFFKNEEKYYNIINDLKSLRNLLISELKLYFSIKKVLKTVFSVALFEKLYHFIELYKKKHNIVPISEFNQKVSDIIDKEIVPFIYWKTGEKIFHFFIDEFQDTSEIQWKNLKPLIENSIAYNYFNLVVGDAKQSIYRWRGGNANIMLSDIYNEFPGKINEEVLYKNYRSSSDIVRFNNLFFADINQTFDNYKNVFDYNFNDIFRVYEKDITFQHINNKETSGYVEFTIVKSSESQNEKYGDSALKLLHNKIIELTLERNYDFKDISVLVRTNSEGSKVAKYLYEQGINVVSSESLMLNSSFIIRLILETLKYILNRKDIYKKGMYINFKRLKTKDEFVLLTIESFEEHDNEFENILSEIENIKLMNLYDTVEQIIKKFDLKRHKDNYIYIQSFLDVIHNYSTKKSDAIINFLEWWEENNTSEKTSVKMPDKTNAVKILSIHKSKGLEFSVVIMPFGNWEIGLKSSTGFMKNYIWADAENQIISSYENDYLVEANKNLNYTYFAEDYKKETEKSFLDNLNLYYVAWTRAVSELYVFLKEEKNVEKFSSYKIITEKLEELSQKNDMTKDENLYFTGNKQKNSKKPEVKADDDFEDIPLINWNDKIIIKKNEYYNENIIKGDIIHKILSNIIEEDDIDFSVEKVLNDNYIAELDKEEIKNLLNQIMMIKVDDNLFSDFFKKGLFVEIEKSIYTPKGIIRPDRIVFFKNKVVIIDYKSGIEEKEHYYQLQKYANALADMGYTNIFKYIVYIDLLKIVKVSAKIH